MPLYYEDDFVTLYHGDSLEILPTLDVKADVLLTDPPYFKVKQEEWDNQWDKATEFLSWMGDFLDKAKPLLTPQASVWVFASPSMTSSVERLVGERFRVLNSIRWAKTGGDNLRRVSMPAMRSFVSIWEGVVFAEQLGDRRGTPDSVLYQEIFAPLGGYFRRERERAGVERNDLEVKLGYTRTKNPERGTELARRWEEGTSLPSQADYLRIRATLGPSSLPMTYAELCAWNSRLNEEYEKRRRPFTVLERRLTEDIWHFPSVAAYPGKHPCEKPESILRHMIECSSLPGDTVLDPFAGSGATLITAAQSGRKAVGIEKEERWCEHAANRLSQGTLELEWTA